VFYVLFYCIGLRVGFEAGTNNWIMGGGLRLADLGDLYAGAFEYSLQAMVSAFLLFSKISMTLP
jgi:hypothetical protein